MEKLFSVVPKSKTITKNERFETRRVPLQVLEDENHSRFGNMFMLVYKLASSTAAAEKDKHSAGRRRMPLCESLARNGPSSSANCRTSNHAWCSEVRRGAAPPKHLKFF